MDKKKVNNAIAINKLRKTVKRLFWEEQTQTVKKPINTHPRSRELKIKKTKEVTSQLSD